VGRLEEAREMYQKRVAIGGWEEERHYARYMAATLAPDWETRCAELLSVWESRPRRLEPLTTLLREMNAGHEMPDGTIQSLHHAAYFLSQVPLDTLPEDTFFIHENCWSWGVLFERSIAAFWVGRHEECLALCDHLLTLDTLPPNIRAQVVVNRSYVAPRPVVVPPVAHDHCMTCDHHFDQHTDEGCQQASGPELVFCNCPVFEATT